MHRTASTTARTPPRAMVERQLRMLVEHAVPGARVSFPRRGDRRVHYSWNGRNLRPTGLTLESQLHEIAHLLVADAKRRPMRELDPYRRSDAARRIPQHVADREERDACTMQMLLARLLGLSEPAIMEEVHAEALSLESVMALRRRRPRALLPAWWRLGCASLAPSESARKVLAVDAEVE